LDQIEVAKLDGKYRETLISGNMVSPRSISVDPNVGLLFWSDWQTEAPRIERASMSGKFREVVFRVGRNGEGKIVFILHFGLLGINKTHVTINMSLCFVK